MATSIKSLNLPESPPIYKLIGPSIILLGLGLGSGELILWPYLVSKYGLGIIWAAIIGITMQFFINMEIERYTLAKGESVFVGFSKLFRFAPYWFIFSTFIAWFWPGIIATSAKIFSSLLGIENFQYVGIAALLLIGLILSLGKSLYKTVESFQKILILVGLPIITFITLMIAKSSDYSALRAGIIGIGDGYRFLPQGIDLFVLLGALAYSGAGGNLNLAQSFYIKEKGYGMCKGSTGIQSLLFGKSKRLSLEGKTFTLNEKNISTFSKWWKLVNLEHLLVFLVTGAITILILALLSYSSVYGEGTTHSGIKFIEVQAQTIMTQFSPVFSTLFLVFVSLMLFGTQLTVLDSTSRIISENIAIIERKSRLSTVYYSVVWLQIVTGVIVFLSGYGDPITLVLIGAVINALAMACHIIMTYFLNNRALDKKIAPSLARKIIILTSFAIFVVLFTLSFLDAIKKMF
ncbi:MAG: hypothetical protein BWY43_00781 [candidate division WS2 bacterium ADurb.Bin280]|uniref:Natural resistance-associated macrophage protein n=1 Tax=candidate division WS2 bacterium ADurb.Bin280 TaxID=1852829 RepID=A0A1V5SCC2_9BACT|nr:MAG: hypothetical protein BWY43_00781 [candidate division WS2 bacterium ADurb.Bin280]